jgi:chloramphenicol 3-O-phosphotransferase
MKALLVFSLSVVASFNAAAAPGRIILFNGTSSAGKSSLAEVVVQESKTKYEVVSFDDFSRSYREKLGTGQFKREPYGDMRQALYRHAKAQADDGRNIIIDTVEFDQGYDKYCEILDCPKVIKAVVYCPLDDILKRIDRRNSAEGTNGRRPVLLSFQQFLWMYKLQTSTNELVVERTHSSRIRTALNEAGERVGKSRQFEALYAAYVKAFGIDKEQELVFVPKMKYDLVLNTRAQTKKENLRILEDYIKSRP